MILLEKKVLATGLVEDLDLTCYLILCGSNIA